MFLVNHLRQRCTCFHFRSTIFSTLFFSVFTITTSILIRDSSAAPCLLFGLYRNHFSTAEDRSASTASSALFLFFFFYSLFSLVFFALAVFFFFSCLLYLFFFFVKLVLNVESCFYLLILFFFLPLFCVFVSPFFFFLCFFLLYFGESACDARRTDAMRAFSFLEKEHETACLLIGFSSLATFFFSFFPLFFFLFTRTVEVH